MGKTKTQRKNKAKQSQSSNNNVKDAREHPAIAWISLVISALAFVLSLFTHISNEESRPLSYFLVPSVTSMKEDTIELNVEFVVSNGSIDGFRVLKYQNGSIAEVADHPNLTINQLSSKNKRTFTYEFSYKKEYPEFCMTEYILVEGKDGSKDLSMILLVVDLNSGTILSDYYSFEDLILAEKDFTKEVYSNALSDYRDLVELLRKNGAL